MPPAITPSLGKLARRALITAGPALAQPHLHRFERRGLSVNHTQAVTLGVIAAYIVIIAILWNVPYIRWVLWPFKVCFLLLSLKSLRNASAISLTYNRCSSLLSTSLATR
jgi:hypothetical protein